MLCASFCIGQLEFPVYEGNLLYVYVYLVRNRELGEEREFEFGQLFKRYSLPELNCIKPLHGGCIVRIDRQTHEQVGDRWNYSSPVASQNVLSGQIFVAHLTRRKISSYVFVRSCVRVYNSWPEAVKRKSKVGFNFTRGVKDCAWSIHSRTVRSNITPRIFKIKLSAIFILFCRYYSSEYSLLLFDGSVAIYLNCIQVGVICLW